VAEHQTVSRVLMSGNTAEKERELLRRWCEETAARGGSFSIVQEWSEQQWFATYTINWPDGVPGRKCLYCERDMIPGSECTSKAQSESCDMRTPGVAPSDDARDAARYRKLRACGDEWGNLSVLDSRGDLIPEALDKAVDALGVDSVDGGQKNG
jgi:hypothetical protein